MNISNDHTKHPGTPMSLRLRYLIVTAVLIVLIFSSAIALHRHVRDRQHESIPRIEERNLAMRHLDEVRNSLIKSVESIDSYMLIPNPEQRKKVEESLYLTIQGNRALYADNWFKTTGNIALLNKFSDEARELKQNVGILMDTRVDVIKQFPMLQVLRGPAIDSYIQFNTAALIAIDSLRRSGNEPEAHAFNHVYDDWLEMNADLRLYSLNAIGSFFKDNIPLQADELEIRYANLMGDLRQIDQRRNSFDIDVDDALTRMFKATEIWYSGFQQTNKLITLGYNRVDAPFLAQRIEPHTQALWDILNEIQQRMAQQASTDVNTLSQLASTTVEALWLLAIIGLSFVIFGYIYFQRSVLQPLTQMAQALNAAATGKSEINLPVQNSDETRQLVVAFKEMQWQVRERQLALEHQAMHDSLTSLPNRLLLHDRLQQAMLRAERDQGKCTLMLMDLDRFKEINDSLGHQTGDRLLRELSQRLVGLMRNSDTVARLGGDEFAIVLPDTDAAHATTVATKIQKSLDQPFDLESHNLYVNCSIGITQYPEHGNDCLELLRLADVAMYEAKNRKSGIIVYNNQQDVHHLRKLSLANELRDAIHSDDIDILFQPQIDLKKRIICGLEVLVRWYHPQHGEINPVEFIPAAEQTGLIYSLTEKILEKSMAQCAAWKAEGVCYGTLSVNVSAYNMQDPEFPRQIQNMLGKWQLDPGELALELTEGVMMADTDRVLFAMEWLHALGVEMIVDDYGTGFSSLAYLKRFPISKLKIDRSFVTDMVYDENDAVIVRSTIDMAHNLGLKVVAEGVEDADTQDLLEILECDLIQGYHVSHPLSVEELARWVCEGQAGEKLVCPNTRQYVTAAMPS